MNSISLYGVVLEIDDAVQETCADVTLRSISMLVIFSGIKWHMTMLCLNGWVGFGEERYGGKGGTPFTGDVEVRFGVVWLFMVCGMFFMEHAASVGMSSDPPLGKAIFTSVTLSFSKSVTLLVMSQSCSAKVDSFF